jgi:IS30 family transposase
MTLFPRRTRDTSEWQRISGRNGGDPRSVTRSGILRYVSILFRPNDVAHRRQFGHSEGDLMSFEQKSGQTDVNSLVERVSRFTVILKNPNRRIKPVMHCAAGDWTAICREGRDHQDHQRPASRCSTVDYF